ncbi:Ig-like domain-containing protein [Edaphobacter bradus]|uniref:Ig-like domain-containing protein n=1 Tax=Edaphobacter bradus TaxID=2259016 RepID=UPI0021E083E0|nr:Ig-like domain-containing protein [Edaphobacter bradus]
MPFRHLACLSAVLLTASAAQALERPAAPRNATLTPTNLVLTIATPTTMVYGQVVDGSAQVTASDGSIMTGTITFYDGAVNLCVLEIAPAASCPASAGEGFAAGAHVLTAVYSGDATHAPSTSNAVTITVLQDTTTATLTSSANPATAGQGIVFTASIQGTHATPAGTATFLDGGAVLGTAPLDATGTATLNTAALAAGNHMVTVTYAATPNFTAATTLPLSQTIQPAAVVPPTKPSFTVGVGTVTVRVGEKAAVPVTVVPANGFSQPVNLACTNLPDETTCAFGAVTIPSGGGATMLTLSTAAPHDCGATAPYGSASLPYAAPAAAGLLVLLLPGRRRPLRGLVATLIALSGLAGMTGCGTGNCTDFGTRPGTYTISVTGTSTGATPATVSQKVVVRVTI